MLHGGDGYLVFTRGRNVINTHLLIRELLANHVKKLGTLKPGRRGRYVDRNPTGKAGLGL
jgi:hypothetical protein